MRDVVSALALGLEEWPTHVHQASVEGASPSFPKACTAEALGSSKLMVPNACPTAAEPPGMLIESTDSSLEIQILWGLNGAQGFDT